MTEIKNRYTGKVIYKYEGADLQGADLRRAGLQGAGLPGADLQGADLRDADLRDADLRRADLRRADLQGAGLRRADLRRAGLQGADLRDANLDFSSGIPFHCGGTGYKGDDRLAAQLVYHLTRGDWSGASGGVQEALAAIRDMAITDLFCEYRGDVQPWTR